MFYLAASWDPRYCWGDPRPLPPEVKSLQIATGEIVPENPVVFDVAEGKELGDFLWNGYRLLVVSGRILGLFRSKGFRGFSTFPVEVRIEGGELPGYTGLAVTGKAGRIDDVRSRAQRIVRPDGTLGPPLRIDGLYFDPRTWDGSDIFRLEDVPGQPLVLDCVVEALSGIKATNFKARPLSDWGHGYRLPRRGNEEGS